MRHRITDSLTGLGAAHECELSNNFDFSTLSFFEEFAKDSIATFSLLRRFQGFDFQFKDDLVTIGIEPAYSEERCEIVGFNLRNKQLCYWKKGIARGPYGTQICSNIRGYDMYKYNSKFIRFIDRWFDVLCSAKEYFVEEK